MDKHTPKLEVVTGTPFVVFCQHCKMRVGAGDGFDTLADLNGTPWIAYYDRKCAPYAELYPNTKRSVA